MNLRYWENDSVRAPSSYWDGPREKPQPPKTSNDMDKYIRSSYDSSHQPKFFMMDDEPRETSDNYIKFKFNETFNDDKTKAQTWITRFST